jgi:hypothetical protein
MLVMSVEQRKVDGYCDPSCCDNQKMIDGALPKYEFRSSEMKFDYPLKLDRPKVDAVCLRQYQGLKVVLLTEGGSGILHGYNDSDVKIAA